MSKFAIKSSFSNGKLLAFKIDGTGTAKLLGPDRNLASLTDNGVGDYTLTLASAARDGLFVAGIFPVNEDTVITQQTDPTTSAIRFTCSDLAASTILDAGIKLVSKIPGADGNNINIRLMDTVSAGAEAVASVGDDGSIVVNIESGVTTAPQLHAALMAGPVAEKTAVLTLNGIKFHSLLQGADGNDISIEVTAGATAGSEVITSTSAGAITIQVESGVSTATQVYAALKAKTDATVNAFVGFELITGATTWAAAETVSLAGGVTGVANTLSAEARNFISSRVTDAEALITCINLSIDDTAIDEATDIFTSTAHGLVTGDVVRVSEDNTLPDGLTDATNYYVIRLTANTFKLAETLADALAGTAIDLVDDGTGANSYDKVVFLSNAKDADFDVIVIADTEVE